MNEIPTLRWTGRSLILLDQRKLPFSVEFVECRTVDDAAEAIRNMTVSGAPAIGAAAAFGLALAARNSSARNPAELTADLEAAEARLRASRPTAVNLGWALDRVAARLAGAEGRDGPESPGDRAEAEALAEALAIAREQADADRRIGRAGLALIPENAVILHHCNTGALATTGIGTALGVVRTAHEAGRRVRVIVAETRPALQGARLTAWELGRLGIPYTLIVDGASGFAMRRLRVDLCLVGADRVAANGDTANKIGTYNLALAAKAHGVPFYVVCPESTLDPSCPDGEAIPIEERDADEVRAFSGRPAAPPDATAWNPSFDITPGALVTGFVTERGVVRPPFGVSSPAAGRTPPRREG